MKRIKFPDEYEHKTTKDYRFKRLLRKLDKPLFTIQEVEQMITDKQKVRIIQNNNTHTGVNDLLIKG